MLLKRKIVKAVCVMTAMAAVMSTASALALHACLSASPLSSTRVNEGGFVAFELKYTNDIRKISLEVSDVKPCGFTGNVYVIVNGNKRIIVVNDIHDAPGENRIRIAGGTAVSSDGMLANAITTERFTVVK